MLPPKYLLRERDSKLHDFARPFPVRVQAQKFHLEHVHLLRDRARLRHDNLVATGAGVAGSIDREQKSVHCRPGARSIDFHDASVADHKDLAPTHRKALD